MVNGATQQADSAGATTPPLMPQHLASWQPPPATNGHHAGGRAIPVASPFQMHNAQYREETRRASYDQPAAQVIAHSHGGSDERLSRELPAGAHSAPLALAVHPRGFDDGPSWTEAVLEAETPRFVPKRMRNEAAAQPFWHGSGSGGQQAYGRGDVPLGDQRGSNDALPSAGYQGVKQEEDVTRSPLNAASTSQQSQAGGALRYTVSQSSELSVPAASAGAAGWGQGGSTWNAGLPDVRDWDEAPQEEVGVVPSQERWFCCPSFASSIVADASIPLSRRHQQVAHTR